MTERSFDPGLDTPRDNEIGAGQPVPGSPVWQDAQNRERANATQRDAEFAAATSPQRGETSASLTKDSRESDSKSNTDEQSETRDDDSAKSRSTAKRGTGRTGR